MASRLVRVADLCWMAVSGSIVSLILGAFCAVAELLALVGRCGAVVRRRVAGAASN